MCWFRPVQYTNNVEWAMEFMYRFKELLFPAYSLHDDPTLSKLGTSILAFWLLCQGTSVTNFAISITGSNLGQNSNRKKRRKERGFLPYFSYVRGLFLVSLLKEQDFFPECFRCLQVHWCHHHCCHCPLSPP